MRCARGGAAAAAHPYSSEASSCRRQRGASALGSWTICTISGRRVPISTSRRLKRKPRKASSSELLPSDCAQPALLARVRKTCAVKGRCLTALWCRVACLAAYRHYLGDGQLFAERGAGRLQPAAQAHSRLLTRARLFADVTDVPDRQVLAACLYAS